MNNEKILNLLKTKEVDIKLIKSPMVKSAVDYNTFFKRKHCFTDNNALSNIEYATIISWLRSN